MTLPGEIPSGADNEIDIDDLRLEIDALDTQILEAVARRQELSAEVGKIAIAKGEPRIEHGREHKTVSRYGVLGPDGKDLALLVLRMSRGRLGR